MTFVAAMAEQYSLKLERLQAKQVSAYGVKPPAIFHQPSGLKDATDPRHRQRNQKAHDTLKSLL
jgi:hypothetical protein